VASRSSPVTALVPKSVFPWGRSFSLAKLRRELNREKITSSSSRGPALTPRTAKFDHSTRVFLKMNSVEQNRDAQRYRILKDYLLRNGFIHYVALAPEESEPFVVGDTFYAQTFEDALHTLDP
jgi:hypothetical protein